MKKNDLLHVVHRWVAKAEEDLTAARHLASLRRNRPCDTICFHAQQCVEKYIKSILVYQRVDFPRTHHISELVKRLPIHSLVPLSQLEQDTLTEYAVIARYPGEWEPATRGEAAQALALAQKVREHVRKMLPSAALHAR